MWRLKTRKLLILRNARNAKNAQIAEVGYTAGTRGRVRRLLVAGQQTNITSIKLQSGFPSVRRKPAEESKLFEGTGALPRRQRVKFHFGVGIARLIRGMPSEFSRKGGLPIHAPASTASVSRKRSRAATAGEDPDRLARNRMVAPVLAGHVQSPRLICRKPLFGETITSDVRSTRRACASTVQASAQPRRACPLPLSVGSRQGLWPLP